MANQFWNQISIHFLFVLLDEFVVMPNHIHCILTIDKRDRNSSGIKRDDHEDENENENKNEYDNGNGWGQCWSWQLRSYGHIIRKDRYYRKNQTIHHG